MKQITNPYLPNYEYVPDGEPRVFGDRVYIYGSHDKFNGDQFCMNDYVCYSAPVDDLTSWRYEGVILERKELPYYKCKPGSGELLFAPDCIQGLDGRYYLFYAFDWVGVISVAVCDTPAGKFKWYGDIHYADGVTYGQKDHDSSYDPGVFIDDDGRVFLYVGFSPNEEVRNLINKNKGLKLECYGGYVLELEKDLLTIKTVKPLLPGLLNAKGTGFEGHEFFEASSLRKFNGVYYFIYSSSLSHELCYATSDRPDGDFKYQGILHSNCDLGLSDIPLLSFGNNHGSLIKINDDYYIFGHRQTNYHQFSRQGVAEKIKFENGKFLQAEMTSQGLNGKPLIGKGTYQACIACNILNDNKAYHFRKVVDKSKVTTFTQEGEDRESNPNQYITNVCDKTLIGYKYFDFDNLSSIDLLVRGKGSLKVSVKTSINGEVLASSLLKESNVYSLFTIDGLCLNGTNGLFFEFEGDGLFDFKEFTLK